MIRSEVTAQLAAALSKAQGEIEGAPRESKNDYFNSQYADLGSCISALRKPFAKYGLSFVQTIHTRVDNEGSQEVGVDTMLLHESGEHISSGPSFYLPVTKADAQGVGSAITYSRRYSLMAITGLAPIENEDDDGNAAAKAKPDKATNKPKTLSNDEFAKHKTAIMEAGSETALRRAYSAGYLAAQNVGDNDALSRFTDMKDERKARLKELATTRPERTT